MSHTPDYLFISLVIIFGPFLRMLMAISVRFTVNPSLIRDLIERSVHTWKWGNI